MRRVILPRLFATIACLLLFAVPSARSQWKQKEWTWKDSKGGTRTRAELDEILEEQREWVKSKGKSGRRAFLVGTELKDAHLVSADLSGAILNDADLSGADLFRADLSGAQLSRAEFKDAWLRLADLTGTIFEPKSLPELRGIAAAQNLELVTYRENPDALAELRKQFKDGGFREQERKITYALKRSEEEIARKDCSWKRPWRTCGTYWFNSLFFDWTCKYGLIPGRPLLLILGFCVLFPLTYWPLMHRRGPAGLYFIGKHAMGKGELTQGIRIFPRDIPPAKTKIEYVRSWIAREWRMARAALCFSILSAFNIGFREFNIGHWIRLLMPQEYSLRAVGAMRTIAGVQSLISVYLVALWILTYFGRPFD